MTSPKPKLVKDMSRDELIEEINVLGPWVHGTFDLGNGLVIEDRDKLHKTRIEKCRDYFAEILSDFYGKKSLEQKSIIDVGCNTGYFLYELQKKFGFGHALGLEPRESNLAKARFIAEYFGLPKSKYQLGQLDILSTDASPPKADVVMMPGVLHHLSDHLLALRNLFEMTRELCIIETCVLPDELNNEEVAQGLFLGESLYGGGRNRDLLGVIGYKLETNHLDGATFESGIVGVTSAKVLAMMMEHVGFTEVKIYRDDTQLRKEVFTEKTYRQYNSAIVVGKRGNQGRGQHRAILDHADDQVENEKFNLFLPMETIKPLYEALQNPASLDGADSLTKTIHESVFNASKPTGTEAAAQVREKLGRQSYFPILPTLRHAPFDKISFEYAKTCYHAGNLKEAREVSRSLTRVMNLDWRTVFLTYFLLARISFDQGDLKDAKKNIELSLRAHPGFKLAATLKQQIETA